MDGAFGFDCAQLRGHRLINLDSEYEGVLMCSCAGGVDVVCNLPVLREEKEGCRLTLTVAHLRGGHSGVEIVLPCRKITLISGNNQSAHEIHKFNLIILKTMSMMRVYLF